MSNSPVVAAQLSYTLLADDVRLEVGNKLSIMGLFQNIFLQSLPATMLKFVVINHWLGNGDHRTQLKIVAPGKNKIVASTEPSQFSLVGGGFADNITVFTNVLFEEEGPYAIQVYLDDIMVREVYFHLMIPPPVNPSIN
jgi:hypothetical protein